MRARRRDDTALALAKTWLVKPVLQESRARARHPPAEASAAISSSTDKKGGSAIPEKPAGGCVVVTRQQSTGDAIAATGCSVVCKNM